MDLLIYGASGLAKEVYDIALRNYDDRWEKIYFIDDFVEEGIKDFGETVKFTTVQKWINEGTGEYQGIVALGEPDYRKMLMEKMINTGIEMVSLIDSTAIISSTAKIGKGVIVCEMASIHAYAEVGDGSLIQPQAIIGHDIRIGKYCVIGAHSAPGGESVFGECSYMGMNATVKEKISIGKGAVIGMGAVVYRDVDENTTVIGNPARVTKGNDDHKVFKR